MGHSGGRLICQWGPVSGNNNEITPNFTRAECNEARANTDTGGGKRIPALQTIRPNLFSVGRVSWAKRIFVMPIL
eukprot:2248409-Pleurochrysis_carterae.AAC.1